MADDEVAGVPAIAPVEVLIDSPDGRDGEITKVIGDVPPLAVTGINEVAAALAVRVSDVIVNVVDRAAEIESEKVFVAVTDAESVTVTV